MGREEGLELIALGDRLTYHNTIRTRYDVLEQGALGHLLRNLASFSISIARKTSASVVVTYHGQ